MYHYDIKRTPRYSKAGRFRRSSHGVGFTVETPILNKYIKAKYIDMYKQIFIGLYYIGLVAFYRRGGNLILFAFYSVHSDRYQTD
jgi:hypothetical protein